MKPEKPKKTKAPPKRRRVRAETEPAAAASKSLRKPSSKKTRAVQKPAEESLPPATALPKAAAVKRTRVTKTAAAASPRASTFRRKISVPPILLEGDTTPAPRPSGPGERYALGSTEPPSLESETTELPESYGTQRLLLVARDPHWLYAHWDMTAEQLRQHNAASRDGHLIVRVFRDQIAGPPHLEQHVHPESRNWFLYVGRGGAKYLAQVGYYDRAANWKAITTSPATFTPPPKQEPHAVRPPLT